METSWSYINMLAVVAILLYWEAREILTSKADKKKGNHAKIHRWAIRLLLPVGGFVLIIQLLGFDPFAVSLSEPLNETLWLGGQTVFWLGIFIGVWARETIGKHWAHAAEYQILDDHKLITEGPYKYIRHPIYTALFAIFLGTQLITPSWFSLLLIPLYLYIRWQAQKEEKLLSSVFSGSYSDYQKKTGRLFPKL